MKPPVSGHNPLPANTSGNPPAPLARLAPEAGQPAPLDPDLARVVAAWPGLPEAIRRAMLALVEVAMPPHVGGLGE